MAEISCLQLILLTHLLSTVNEMRNWCRHAAMFAVLSLLYWQTELPKISDTEYSLSSISMDLGGTTRNVKDSYELFISLAAANIKLGLFLVMESMFFDRSQLFSAITMVRMLAVLTWWEVFRSLKLLMIEEGAFEGLRRLQPNEGYFTSFWIYLTFHICNILPDVLRLRFFLLFIVMSFKIFEKLFKIGGVLWCRFLAT